MRKILSYILSMVLLTSSGFAQIDEKSDVLGDWRMLDGGYFAQIFFTPENNYQLNIVRDIISREAPIAILKGESAQEAIIKFSGDGWTGSIKNEKLLLNKGSEKLEMEHFHRTSPSMNAPPPPDAIVLFDGTNMDSWTSVMEKDWLVGGAPADNWLNAEDGIMEVVPHDAGSYQSIISKQQFGDLKMHLEFRLISPVTNGGLYLMSRYEINIKDAYGQIGSTPIGFGNVAEPKDLYPEVNVAFPLMEWQTFDIDFKAPRFNDSGIKTEDARISILHNGVLIYNDVAIKAVRGSTARLGEATLGPLYLQEHGVPYQFRNIWLVDKSLSGKSTLKAETKTKNTKGPSKSKSLVGKGNGGKAKISIDEGKSNGSKSVSDLEKTTKLITEKYVNSNESKISGSTDVVALPPAKKGGNGKSIKASYQEELNPAYAEIVLNIEEFGTCEPSAPSGFVHPGVLLNIGQLEELKKRVLAGTQPQKTAFDALKESDYGDLNYKANPVDSVFCGPHSNPNIGCKDEQSDCVAAYTHALLWVVSGNKYYAEKAIEIMNNWSYTLVGGHSYGNGPIQTAWAGAVWPRAAEIIRYTYGDWSDTDVLKFQNMLRTQYLPTIMHGDCENGNKELAMADALVNIGVFLDDKDVFNLGIKMWRGRTPAYIYLKEDGPIPIEPPGCGPAIWGNKGFTPDFVNGILQETARDSHHAWYAFSSMINAAETAYIQGVDLYGEQSKRIMAALEFQAQYLKPNDVPAPKNLIFALQPTWEIAYNHFHNRMGFPLPKMSVVIPTNRPTGVNHHMAWESFTHGDMGKVGLKPLVDK